MLRKKIRTITLTVVVVSMIIFVGCENKMAEGVLDSQDYEEDLYLSSIEGLAKEIGLSKGENAQLIINELYEEYSEEIENIYFANVSGKMMLCPPIDLPEEYNATTRQWYQEAVRNDIYHSDVYEDLSSNKKIQSIAKAVYYENQLIGVIGIDYEVENSDIHKDAPSKKTVNEDFNLSEEQMKTYSRYTKEVLAQISDQSFETLPNVFSNIVKNSNEISYIYMATNDKDMVIAPYVELPDQYDPTTRPWFTESSLKDMYFSNIYIDASSNASIVTVAKQIHLMDGTQGVIGIDFIVEENH